MCLNHKVAEMVLQESLTHESASVWSHVQNEVSMML